MGRDNVFKEPLLFRAVSSRIFAKLSSDIWGGVCYGEVDDMMVCINYGNNEAEGKTTSIYIDIDNSDDNDIDNTNRKKT